MQKIAVFGGSFDPIHLGHLAVIDEALSTLEIDRLIVVPTHLNPLKKEYFLDPKKRLRLVQEALKNRQNVDVEAFEVKKGSSYTIDTLNYLQQKYNANKIFLIIGADNLASLHRWRAIETIKKKVTFVVATRQNITIPKEFLTLHVKVDISSTHLRAKLDRAYLPKEISSEL